MLFVWWNGHIDPASINLTAMINVLVIAVIGGLYRLEGHGAGAARLRRSQQRYGAADLLDRPALRHGDRRDLLGFIIVLVSP